MMQFRNNEVEESIKTFDEVLALDESKRPYLWQRGLSLYYVQEFKKGSEQFRIDVAVNPNDTEESIWALMCEAMMSGFDKAQSDLLVVGRDVRPVMRAAYEMFRGDGSKESLKAAAASNDHDHDAFYSLLYQGLYFEARSDALLAKDAILRSLQTTYAQSSDDYMVSLAAIHVKRRSWDV